MKRLLRCVVATVAVLVVGEPAFAQSNVTTVYVYTAVADAQHPTADETERLALVDNVKKTLPDNKRISSQIALADSKELATISFEVVTASIRESLLPATRGEVFVKPIYTAKATLRFGPIYTTEFNAISTQDSYRRVANAPAGKMESVLATLMRIDDASTLSGDVRTWIAANEADLHKK